MPTGNSGYTRGLALRLTNMEQGRREVDAYMANKTLIDYKQKAAEQREAERNNKRIEAITKDIKLTDAKLHPIYSNVKRAYTAKFLDETIQNMKSDPLYTSTENYRQKSRDFDATMSLYTQSSNSINEAAQIIAKNPEDYEWAEGVQEALNSPDGYEKFIKANGGTDYVGTSGSLIREKFNTDKTRKALMTAGQASVNPKVTMEKINVGTGNVVITREHLDPANMIATRDAMVTARAQAGSRGQDLERYAENVDAVLKTLVDAKEYDAYRAQVAANAKPTLPKGAAYKSKETAHKFLKPDKKADKNAPPVVTKTGKTKTIKSPTFDLTDYEAQNANVLTYNKKGQDKGMTILVPNGGVLLDDKGVPTTNKFNGTLINAQLQVLKDGRVVVVGAAPTEVKDGSGAQILHSKQQARVLIPADGISAAEFRNTVSQATDNNIELVWDNGKYTYTLANDNNTETTKEVKQAPKATTKKGTKLSKADRARIANGGK